MIPDSLFTCESLRTLDFQFPELNWRLELPESISLPRLKILRLTNIIYDDEKLAGKLFSSFPILEELCLTNCRWENFDFISFSAPALTLTGGGSSRMEYAKIKIDAPNLMSFTFRDWLPEGFVVDSFPLLHDADICFEGDIEYRSGPLSKFIKKFCNVKLLKISGAYFKILKRANVLSTSFPTFGNLIRLEVDDIQMKTLLNFLELSPNLESLVINEVEYMGGENVSTFKVVPQCLVVSLKSIEIRKFTGYLEMVKFVLKHGRVLQTVIIDDYKTEAKWVEASNKSLMTMLRRTPWASAGCVIKFLSNHGTCCEFRL
ncbi:putative F-box/FBD/LRR-repeat protein At5g22670 [Papaver somniferum]|uniref:putative F-box/FBD/LRR-repeat protein At5g22670 n=1 Tax=Papaver somniferum TaxID=3469 RepID=UPI000E6FEC85|nr:putative F-box/FBD/LRR-repeat protein At5g22670 [Papaver somniferum]